MEKNKKYTSFQSFYKYYLTEHADVRNRLLHFTGTFILIASFIAGIITLNWIFFAIIPVVGYGFAWIGHYFIERNKPATFTYPFYSLASDFVMFWHILTGQLESKLSDAKKTINNNLP